MAATWFYNHSGRTHGPFSTAELHRRAATGLLGPDDLIWREKTDPQHAVVAGAALAFPTQAGNAVAMPDWLSDVRRAEQAASQPRTPKPDWLEDVRSSVQHDSSPGAPTVRGHGKARSFSALVIRLLQRCFRTR
jgi:hypothetical protein